ncbi:hypothetical protein QL285_080673 [Trifolium repens]|nr:hypothetical protein QL285_080673 [Trifolium repens]
MGLFSAIGAPSLRNGVYLLPCGGSSPISVGFSSYFAIPFSSFVPPPPPSTSIMFLVQPSINHQALSTQIKYAMVLSNLNPTSTECLQTRGHVKRPPPEPPPTEKMKVLRFCVCICVFLFTDLFTDLYLCFRFAVVIVFVFVFSCCYVRCVLLSSLIYVKFALMVFDKKPQSCLVGRNHAMSKNLIVTAANQFLLSTQQRVPSQVVSLTNFENPDSRYVRPQAKEMIRN